MNELNLFIPLTKIDEEKRLVYGVATAEAVDRTNEICDYASTKPYYEKWSEEFHKASGGKSLGNLRAMHGKVAAGRIEAIHFNDEAKQIEICSKVVDDNEWKKVLAGVYTGFSQGGAYVKRWDDPDDPTIKRYTADPTEVSLVDLPCLKTATFEVIKADGHTELRKFHSMEKSSNIADDDNTNEDEDYRDITDEDIQTVAEGIAEAHGKAKDQWKDYIDDAYEGLFQSLVSAEKVLKDFNEANHPRDEHGRFSTVVGGAAGAVSGAATAAFIHGNKHPLDVISGAVAGGAIGAYVGAGRPKDSNGNSKGRGYDLSRAIKAGAAAGLVGSNISSFFTNPGIYRFRPGGSGSNSNGSGTKSGPGGGGGGGSGAGGSSNYSRGPGPKTVDDVLYSLKNHPTYQAMGDKEKAAAEALIRSRWAKKSNKFLGTTMNKVTNSQIASKATELAKAAGDETRWADYLEKATELLYKDDTEKGGKPGEKWTVTSKDENKDVVTSTHDTEDGAKAEMDKRKGKGHTAIDCKQMSEKAISNSTLEKINTNEVIIDNDVKQVWQARDGKTFAKKAEVIAYHRELDTQTLVKTASGPAFDALEKITDVLHKKNYSDDERKEMADKGEAKPDGSYPIKTVQDLKNAVRAWGRGGATQSDKDHIKVRANALGATAELPEDWGGAPDKSTKDNLGKGGGDTAPDGDTFDHQALSDLHRTAAKDFADKAKDHATDGNAKQASIHRDNSRAHDDAADLHDRANVLQSSNHPDANNASKDAFTATDNANKKTGTAISYTKSAAGELKKGLPTVAELAYLIERLKFVAGAVHMEAKQENDGSTIPDKLHTNISDLCSTLNDMCQEETAELIQGQNVDDLNNVTNVFNMAAGMAEGRIDALVKYVGATKELETLRPIIEKIGAAISAANLSKIQQAHDALIELGAVCGGANAESHELSGEINTKHSHTHDLTKVLEERDALQKAFSDLTLKLSEVATEVEKLKAQPVARPNLRVVNKGDDLGLLAREDDGIIKAVSTMTPEQKAALFIKLSQSKPLNAMGRGA